MINVPLYMRQGNRTRNEPKVYPLMRDSFISVSSAGLRTAPEVLVLELMREIFFTQEPSKSTSRRELNPDDKENGQGTYRQGERAVLYALRGRRKMTKHSSDQRFFAPAYPQLARAAWLGSRREHVIYHYLLAGPIAQYLWSGGEDSRHGRERQRELAVSMFTALIGNKSCYDDQSKGKDILSAILAQDAVQAEHEFTPSNKDTITGTIIKKTMPRGSSDESLMKLEKDDELATRITRDFLEICNLEKSIPRMQWMQLLMTFLRFSMPMWLLAQMQITRLFHSWLLDTAHGEHVEPSRIYRELARRNLELLHPSRTPTRELLGHIENYMKCRVEINILLYCLEQVNSGIQNKKLMLEKAGSNSLSLVDLLTLVRNAVPSVRNLDRFKEINGNSKDLQVFLTREGEQFPAWRHPLQKGQGKNIDEFFRVLYRAEMTNENSGHLLIPELPGKKRAFKVYPGQVLLKMVTHLAARNKGGNQEAGGTGKLMLQDIEDFFAQYGIDFSVSADARLALMKDLQALGLLTGSPDAGSSVAVTRPYG